MGAEKSQKRILVIEDSKTQALKLRATLEEIGSIVDVAESAEQGIDLSSKQSYDLIIVDYMLPGMNGHEFCRAIRMDISRQNIPILIFTEDENETDELKGLESGADDYLTKNSSKDLLLARVKNLLRKSSSENPYFGPTQNFLKGAKILIIDDSATYRLKLKKDLEEKGLIVDQASDGKAGIKKAFENTYDCIIVDLMMPEIDGIEVCENIHKKRVEEKIPLVVLMLTASEDKEALTKSLEVGADDFVSKQSEVTILIGRIQALLRRKYFEEQNRRILEELKGKEVEKQKALFDKQLADEKAQASKIFETLADNAPIGIFFTDEQGGAEYANKRAKDILELPLDKILGFGWGEALHPEDKDEFINNWLAAFQKNEAFTQEFRIACSNDRVKHCIANAVPIEEASDKKKYISLVQDISQEKALQNMRDTYHGVLSHELRSPLAQNRSVLELVLDGLLESDPNKARRLLRSSAENLDYSFRLMDNLVFLLKAEKQSISSPEKINLKELYKGCAEIIAPKLPKNIELEFQSESKNIDVAGNQDLLKQVFINLMNNALRFAKSKLLVHVMDCKIERNNGIQVCIANDGNQIPEDTQEKLFDKFHQAKSASGAKEHKGTGLGLALCKQIVINHGGRIWVENLPNSKCKHLGKGVVFCFTLLQYSTKNAKLLKGNDDD